ncbi:MAG: AAA family ATPase, partial [Pseudomonadales bacterium]
MPSTANASNSITPQFQAAIGKIKLRAKEIIKTEPENTWRPLLRNVAAQEGVDLDIKDLDLESFLDEAERSLDPSRVYHKGDKLQATESVFMLDGLIKLGEANVVIGQPKVGKSSFSTGLIAALRDKREQFLGRDLLLPETRMPVLIFGTDQSEGDWLHFLKRENLVNEEQALTGAVDFFCSLESSNDYNFTREGLRNMRTEIEKHQLPLVIIDSLSSMMEPTGIEENTSRYAQPIRSAIRELRKTGATLLIIHHSVKRPTTWDWIVECRGSSSISSVFSWGVLMRWVAQEEDGLARSDRRVGFTGKGRGSAEAGGVMAEYLQEGGWTFLDGLEQAQQVERIGQRIGELGGVRAQVFDYVATRAKLNADVSTEEVASELNKQISAVSRELRMLKS